MANDVDVRVLDRAQQPVGHLLPLLVESRVHGCDDEIERREAVVGEIERPVRLDVALDAGEDADAPDLRVQRAARAPHVPAPAARPARSPSPVTGCGR